jgi:hypothetical protein
MDPFFTELGRKALARWSDCNFNPGEFPRIARELLEERPPSQCIDISQWIRDFLLRDEQPMQSQSSFGQPELIVFEDPRLYIQVLFWMEGTTDIHQHMFSGAFHVLEGSSIHSQFRFEERREISAHMHVGRLRLEATELLEAGQTREIVAGPGLIHALFHMDMPSVTVVLRTQTDAGSAPQWTYLPPRLAVDPLWNDALTTRRKQLLDVLERVGDEAYVPLVLEMLERLDFERGFFVLQNSVRALRDGGAWDGALNTFVGRHGALAVGIGETIREIERRDSLVALRSVVEDADHRFFLALLLNVPEREGILRMVGERFPGDPVETVMRWLGELGEETDEGVRILDAVYPEDLGTPVEEQAGAFLVAIADLLTERPDPGRAGLREPSAKKGTRERLRSALVDSSLRVLLP